MRASTRGLSLHQRFDQNYTMEPNSGCWLWLGSYWVNKTGYIHATVWGNGKIQKAARVAYERFVGPLKKGDILCHKCNVSLCVNPAHLYAGTYRSNHEDAVAAGRFRIGTGVYNRARAKLTAEQVLRIVKDSRPREQIAKEYGVDGSAIGYIKRGCIWQHVTGITPSKVRASRHKGAQLVQ